MAIVVYTSPDAMTVAQYDAIIAGLRAVGQFPPAGMMSHACFGSPDQLRVCDVFDSEANWLAFAQHLGPQVAKAGVGGAEPHVIAAHAVLVPGAS